jgi:quinolinate synthase
MTEVKAGLPSNLEEQILKLKKEMNAVILAHYYQNEDIQDIADFVGDSLDLSRKAAATEADVIVFCGVKFMAEVAKILNPTKKVIIPDLKAGCSLEDSCKPEAFRRFREQHPHHIALTYINCSAEVKALSDIIVTSTKFLPISQLSSRRIGIWENIYPKSPAGICFYGKAAVLCMNNSAKRNW